MSQQLTLFFAHLVSAFESVLNWIGLTVFWPLLNSLTGNDPKVFYRELLLSIIMYLLTTATLGLLYGMTMRGFERRASARRETEQKQTLAPFRSVLVSKLVATQSDLLLALTEVTWEGNWGRPRLRSLGNRVGQVAAGFSDYLLSSRSVLNDREQLVFGVYAKLLSKLKSQIDDLKVDPNKITSDDIRRLEITISEINECLSNIAQAMESEFAERIRNSVWTREQLKDLDDALWGPLLRRSETNAANMSAAVHSQAA